MTEILSWVLQIVLKTALIVTIWLVVKHIIRNGGTTLSELLKTTTLAIRYGCLKLQSKLVNRLRERAEEKETEEKDGPEVKVEGTVV